MSEPEDTPEMQARRAILRRAAWLLGGAISAPAAMAVLQGCYQKTGPGASGTPPATPPKFLTEAELALVAEIAELLIPRTHTSGARDAGVPAFIDQALDALYSGDDQARYKAGLAEFETAARASGKPFLEQDEQARGDFLHNTLAVALGSNRKPRPFILVTRELTLLGYFSSQVGITENMEYVAVPTAYHGCVPLSQMKKHVYWE
jgi:gluconate 2-dehydrogenase gamma chain